MDDVLDDVLEAELRLLAEDVLEVLDEEDSDIYSLQVRTAPALVVTPSQSTDPFRPDPKISERIIVWAPGIIVVPLVI